MGMRFRKSIKIAPGVRFNLGKKSAGISIGGKHGGMSYNTRTGARVRASAPGTGLSYSTKLSGSKSRASATGLHTDDYAVAPDYKDTTSYPVEISSPSELREQAAKLQSNLNLVKIAYPILILLFVVMGFSIGPFCFVVAVVLALYAINFRKKALSQIPILIERADQLALVQDELHTIEDAERELSSTKSAAIFFLNYERLLGASVIIAEKAPTISQYANPDDCRQAISEVLNSEIGKIIKTDFEKTYKHLFELKTQKGITSAIDKFKTFYEPNLGLLNDGQQRVYMSYVKKLESVNLSNV